ncbi:hypothetical protein PC119_g20212 [Phytophthora cactorum]|nr:hypothetical protein PC112_g22186 [Phytophthora cactorum]KAG2985127.1 hypothetical protein PC119_g20212 [Phytophthora cactorum]
MRRLLRRVRQLEEQTLVGHLCRKAADKAEREQRIADTKALGADLRGLKLQLKIMFDAYIPAESLEDLVPLPLAPRLVPTEQPSPRTPVSTPAFTANKQKPSQNPAPLMQSRSTTPAPSSREKNQKTSQSSNSPISIKRKKIQRPRLVDTALSADADTDWKPPTDRLERLHECKKKARKKSSRHVEEAKSEEYDPQSFRHAGFSLHDERGRSPA